MKNAVMPKERGESNLGCLVLILLVTILSYLCYRIIPVYWEQDAFHEELLRIAGRATIARWENRKIVSLVMQLNETTKFTVEEKDIQVQHIRGRPEVVLVVNYSRREEFPGGYVYIFYFRSAAQGSLGL